MIKKMASIFKKKEQRQTLESMPLLEKEGIDTASKPIFDARSHRLPGFPEGIPVVSIELLFHENDEMIKQIILARGMSGSHNKEMVEAKIMSPIRHLAEMTHLLPASDKDHYKLPGGLFAFCLETALFSIRYAERRILTRATPEIRKEEESLWAHAAFLAGLFCEAIAAISKLSVYGDEIGIEWNPNREPLNEWLQMNQLKRYHIRWRAAEERAVIVTLVSKAIQEQQSRILDKGERGILNSLISALMDKKDHRNTLANIVDKVSYKIQQREVWSDEDRYGKPLTGMHLEPWLIDAMRNLVEKKRWAPNEDNGRIWHGLDGIFLVWPLAASDMQYQLKAGECPFIPNTQEILADIMLDAGIIEKSKLGGYLFDIGIPVADSEEKKHVEALKLARHEILFTKTPHKPIGENLQIKIAEDNEDSDDEESAYEISDEKARMMSDAMDIRNDQDIGPNSNETSESITQSLKPDEAPVDMNILFGKSAEPVIEHKNEILNKLREEDPDIEAIFSIDPVSSAENQYDDDYSADYQPLEKSEQTLSVQKDAASEKSKRSESVKHQEGSKEKTTGIEELFGKVQTTDNAQSGRAVLILNRLKRLPTEYLETQPNGITKVLAIGLKNTKLDLKDCVTVLKSAELLVLVDGYETGLGGADKPKSRYFLVKADLLDGK